MTRAGRTPGHRPPAQRRTALALLALAAITTAGCARGMHVGSEPTPVASITVENGLGEPMIVSYSDSRGEALLGTVAAGGSERFVIASREPSITVRARNAAGNRTAGPYTVQLIAGASTPVRLR
jgi:hypothetical protein